MEHDVIKYSSPQSLFKYEISLKENLTTFTVPFCFIGGWCV